jgi:hypothetical protein
LDGVGAADPVPWVSSVTEGAVGHVRLALHQESWQVGKKCDFNWPQEPPRTPPWDYMGPCMRGIVTVWSNQSNQSRLDLD